MEVQSPGIFVRDYVAGSRKQILKTNLSSMGSQFKTLRTVDILLYVDALRVLGSDEVIPDHLMTRKLPFGPQTIVWLTNRMYPIPLKSLVFGSCMERIVRLSLWVCWKDFVVRIIYLFDPPFFRCCKAMQTKKLYPSELKLKTVQQCMNKRENNISIIKYLCLLSDHNGFP